MWNKICFKKVYYEFLAMTLFVYIGCGVAMTTLDDSTDVNSWRLQTAFAFGMAIMVLVYTTAHKSGGQINSAVTWALVIAREVTWQQGVANTVGQFAGSILGAILLEITIADATIADQTSLGANAVSDKYADGQAFLGEFMMTFLLCWVVFETAINTDSVTRTEDSKNPTKAPMVIGFAVFLAHLVLLPITGCSINPPRSFGPALIASFGDKGGMFDDYWIFFIAPHLGGAAAGMVQRIINDGGVCPKSFSDGFRPQRLEEDGDTQDIPAEDMQMVVDQQENDL